MSRLWTAADDARLRELWQPTMTLADLAAEFDRTPHAILSRATELHLPTHGRRTEAEGRMTLTPRATIDDNLTDGERALVLVAWWRGAISTNRALRRLGMGEEMQLRALADRLAQGVA